MKVQRVKLPDSGKITWLVVDNDYKPVETICTYLRYLDSLERSPNTIHTYASHLKLYWEFLQDFKLEWQAATLENLADFITWLRRPDPKVVSLQKQEARRTESSINTILSVVHCFYDYQERLGKANQINGYSSQSHFRKKYKSFLHHINKGKETRTKLLKLKEPKSIPKTLTKEEVKILIEACKNTRDKFLLSLLYETGMRIGQVLGLRHEDIRSFDNEVQITPRNDNANGARAKAKKSYVVHVSEELMKLYSEYLIDEYPEDIDSDYLFINIWEGKVGYPMSYSTIQSLFKNLSLKTGIEVHPHMFRHTHATELIRSGTPIAFVSKRLGHASVQTTTNTYMHLTDEDMKQAYQKFLNEGDK